MQVGVRKIPDGIEPGIQTRVVGDVTAALQSVTTSGTQFIVNNTIWYGRNRQGKVTVQVVNSAGYISRKFATFLEQQKGWERQKTLAGQTIDAYIEIQSRAGHTLLS